jgi:NAD(P)-dependent dehydrogenase (short-subunit alcohol dehydrogenase family)
MLRLDGQTAIVGGGAGEIGAAAATLLAELGARVWIADTNAARLEALRDSLSSAGRDVRISTADLTVAREVSQVVDSLIQEWSTVDIAVNAVGWTDATPFVEEDEAYWRRVIDLNLMSSIHLAHAVLPRMQAAHYGRLIFVSSLAGRIGRRGRALYSASKAGLIGLAKALALEVATDGITVNTIAPGATDTALMRAQGEENTRFALAGIPRGRFATPRDQAYGIAFLATPEAAHITGQTLAIDGGQTMV